MAILIQILLFLDQILLFVVQILRFLDPILLIFSKNSRLDEKDFFSGSMFLDQIPC